MTTFPTKAYLSFVGLVNILQIDWRAENTKLLLHFAHPTIMKLKFLTRVLIKRFLIASAKTIRLIFTVLFSTLPRQASASRDIFLLISLSQNFQTRNLRCNKLIYPKDFLEQENTKVASALLLSERYNVRFQDGGTYTVQKSFLRPQHDFLRTQSIHGIYVTTLSTCTDNQYSV